MAFKVYGDKEKDEKPDTYFKLLQYDNYVTLVVTDENGKMLDNGFILKLIPDKAIKICSGLTRRARILLDEEGLGGKARVE